MAARKGDRRRPEPPGPRSPPRAPRSSSRIPLRPPPHGSMPPFRILGGLLAGPLVPTVVPTGLLVPIENCPWWRPPKWNVNSAPAGPFESAAHAAPITKRAPVLPEHHKRGSSSRTAALATGSCNGPTIRSPSRGVRSRDGGSPQGPVLRDKPARAFADSRFHSRCQHEHGVRSAGPPHCTPARARSHPAIPRPGRPPEAAPHRLPPRVPTAAPERRQARSAPPQPTLRTPAPGRPRRPRPADTAEDDLPDSSQYGNSSHPQRRMRAVQRASDLASQVNPVEPRYGIEP